MQEARTEQRLQMAGRLNQVMAAAIDTLGELVLHDDPRIALRAIGIVMGNAQQFAATAQSDERLRQLEAHHVGGERLDIAASSIGADGSRERGGSPDSAAAGL